MTQSSTYGTSTVRRSKQRQLWIAPKAGVTGSFDALSFPCPKHIFCTFISPLPSEPLVAIFSGAQSHLCRFLSVLSYGIFHCSRTDPRAATVTMIERNTLKALSTLGPRLGSVERSLPSPKALTISLEFNHWRLIFPAPKY
jgi:hypothetical protein